ncbi:UDP-N-acetyl-D-glucosamine 6-dehydrogenase [Propionicimonas sp. T2.31MG-18]
MWIEDTHLVVMGQGYVGLPMALRAAEAGIRVTGFDTNRKVTAALGSAVSHIGDVTSDQLKEGLARGYNATSDPACLRTADVVIVCVPTPLGPDGGPDLRAVEAAADLIGENIPAGALCILESTTYPGTTEEVFAPRVCRDRLVVGDTVHIAFSPERINPGQTEYGVQNTPKVVGGLTPACTARAAAFYERFIDEVVSAKGAKEAEMAKLLENTFRHVNIALVNEMARFSRELGIDLWDAIDCAETKPFGFMAFRPGPGVGGHCIPVDPSYLSHRVRAVLGYSFRMVELAEEVNTAAPVYVAQRVADLLNERSLAVKGARVLLLGVTYKPDVADMRETPAAPLASRLLHQGAKLSYHDPLVASWHVDGRDLACVTDPYAAAQESDLVVFLQAHSAYDRTRLQLTGAPLFDTRGVLPTGDNVTRL